ncbi:uncharacterized protein [Dermacentor albipictus]|uniref:uncharacterized protein isoform X2 n=1 Tax=Dermacentor albipictus TaxID=60249 RepID=UPI0031FC9F8F
MQVQRTSRSPSPEAPPEHYGLRRYSRNRGSATSCDSPVNPKRYDVERPATLCSPRRTPQTRETSRTAAGASETYVANKSGALHMGRLRSVSTLMTDRHFRMSASAPTSPLRESCGEDSDFTKTVAKLSKYLKASTPRPQIQLPSESKERESHSGAKGTPYVDGVTASSPDHTSHPSLSQGLEISTQVHKSFPAVSHGRPVSRKARIFVKDHSKSSWTTRNAVPKKRHEEPRLSSSGPVQLPSTTKGAGLSKAYATPDTEVHAAEGTWKVCEPRLQQLVAARHKMTPFTPSADRCETQVMTVLVSRLGNRSTLSAAAPGTEAARLFAKPSYAYLPIGAAARTTATGRPTGDFANANMGAAGGSAPAGLTSQGPAVRPQAAVARPSADQAKANVVAATRAASVGASSATPVVTVKRPFVLPPPAPAQQPVTSPKIQPPTGPPPQSQVPATAGAAARGVGATTVAGQAASAAAPVGSGPPAAGAVATASPASPARVTIGSASGPAATSASGAGSMAGFSAGPSFSPVLDSELFDDSEFGEEPEYELSDTTILDVHPCLLLPLSGCNFLLIVASLIFFFGALYAYFDQESTPASTSTNTWLVYVFLHLETVFMVVSLLVFLVASVGFLGALRENVALLDMYTTLHGAFITAELVFVFIVFFLPVIGREFVISHITTDLIVHYRDNPDYEREIDYVQSSLHCCGMTENAYRDWNANEYFNCSTINPSAERCSVPPSCCRKIEPPHGLVFVDDSGPTTPLIASGVAVEEEHESEENVDGDVYVPTLCGRGVMSLKEEDAWKVVYRGQKNMKQMNTPEEEAALVRTSPQGPPLVASQEARRQRHRRRYLDVRPVWKTLPKQAAPAVAKNNA